MCVRVLFFFKQKTAYELRISDWSSDVCSSELDAPADVVKLALRATNAIGEGLYGVDIKATKDGVLVIEVNDNPSIDAGVEDGYLGEDLYRRIMDEFLRRLERKRLGIRD